MVRSGLVDEMSMVSVGHVEADGVMAATAVAHPNIALVKYWGKRDACLNLPAAGSLSITLDRLSTRTRVAFDVGLASDELWLNGRPDNHGLARASACLDVLRRQAGTALRARIDSTNDFPTAAGLASSASGFAALVVAADHALGLHGDRRFLSALARQGSGSAARSLFGGFVLMRAGHRDDGLDAAAEPLLDGRSWPLEVVVAVTSEKAKQVTSGKGMEATRQTSPYHVAWIDSVAADLQAARNAITARDFAALATVSEHSCLKMHADMLATRPPLVYWQPATVACLQRIRALRETEGLGVFFTIDAGPQVKAVCEPGAGARVAAELAAIDGVVRVLHGGLGQGAHVVESAS